MPEPLRSPFVQFSMLFGARVKARWVALAICSALAVLTMGTRAQLARTDAPPNFDIRTDRQAPNAGYASRFLPPASAAGLRARRATAVAELQKTVPFLELEVNPAMQTPEVVGVRAGFGFLTAPSPDRAATMRAFLSANADVYGLTQAQVGELRLVADYMNPAGNMGWVEFEQVINGYPVFQGLIRGGFTSRGELARTTGPLAAGMDPSFLPVAPVLSAGDAMSYASQSVGGRTSPGALTQKGADANGRTTFGRGAADEGRAWLTYFPLAPGVARLAWATESMGDPDSFLILVDSENGTVLFRKNLTEYQTQTATYHVYNDDSPAPHSPTTSTPGSGFQAPLITRTGITLIGNEGFRAFNNLGWMTDGTNLTDGNNVEAGLDLVGPDGVDAPVAGAARVFNFAYNPAPGSPPPGDSPTLANYRNGEVTDMFFWTNMYHDSLYQLGFNEVARNFQNNNFGRGGAQADRVSAEAQDASGTNNANFTTPSDGLRGKMQMYIFPGPNPDRTSALDHDVLIHELTHGTSNRLHNNAAGLSLTMARGMGEGWSDFYARSLLATADEDPRGVYSTGGWVTYFAFYQGIGVPFTDNYYYGIRRFPYAVKSKLGANGKPHNPLTFADIDPAQINLTDGAFPNSALIPPNAFEVHNIGEVWAMALFEVRALFIQRLGFAVGNQRFMQFVTDGMKLDPTNPSLLQGRDSILAAANAGGGTVADIDDIWTGFAIRGMGRTAQVLDATTGSVVEAFDVPGVTANPPMTLVTESIANGRYDSGETVTVSLCLTNTALSASATVTGTLLATGGVLSPSGPQSYGSVPSGGNVCRNFTFVVGPACGGQIRATLQTQEPSAPTELFSYTANVGSAAGTFFEFFDSVTAPALPPGWTTVNLGGTVNNWITDTVAPHSLPNRASVGNPATTSDNALVSPVIALPAGLSAMIFRNFYNTEASDNFYDGGVLEISIAGGPWTDIIAAGGTFTANGYNATIFVGDTNPLAGRQAWSGNSGSLIQTNVNLPPASAGQNIQLRWRIGTDSIISAPGWFIDSVGIFTLQCSNQVPVITTQPASQTVMSGNSTTLSVVAAGSGTLTYQWYRGLSGDTSTPIGGATAASYNTGALVAPANYWVQIGNGFGLASSATAAITIGPASGINMVQNGNFGTGALAPWTVFEEPNIQWAINANVFEYWRQNPGTGSTQAVVFQNTGLPVAANTPLQAQFRIGNSSTVRKRISVLIIDGDFSDITVCTFWLAPSSPLALYTMNTRTTKAWSNAAIYFYAATKGQDGGNYRLDDVTLTYVPGLPLDRTDCIDPTAPPPPGGSPGADLIVNGHFQAGGLTGWAQFGSMTWQVEGGIFEFIRPLPLPNPAGVIFQNTGVAMPLGTFYSATFQFGNSSTVRKRITVLIQESDFSDLMACTFWLAPLQPVRDYVMGGYTTKAWTNATLAIYNASVGSQTWTQVDNVTFRTSPGTGVFGTQCIEPAPGTFFAPGGSGGRSEASAPPAGGIAGGGASSDGGEIDTGDSRHGVLDWGRPIDLTEATSAMLTFDSKFSGARASGEVRVTTDGVTWESVAEVENENGRVLVDLNRYLGRVVYVRFVSTSAGPMSRPSRWSIGDVAIIVR